MSLAEIDPVNWVLLMKLVVRALPFHCTTEPETKFVPVTVSVNAVPPGVALEGESKVAVGAELLMVKVRVPDVPPPGEGLTTVIETVPAVAMSLAEIDPVNWVLLTKLVARALPFHCTTELETKFAPVTVSVNVAPPAVALEGESKVAVGAELLMVKVRAPDDPPPGEGFTTVIESVPAVAMLLAEIAAVNRVLLTKLVARALPFHCTTEPERKFVPVTVSVNAVPPGVALEGESKVAVGAGLLMVKVRAPDVPPPGEGFATVTESVPAVAMSLAEIAAVNWVLLTKLVARALPFHCTVEPETKFVPVTVSVNVAPPAVALEGESKEAVGAALLMVKVRAPDVPPPGEGFTTVIETVPVVAMSFAEIAAVNWVLLTKLVARALPFHCTVEPETKFVPVTVSVNVAPPAVTLEGESKVAVSAALLMVKVRAPDVPPPGEGFTTVTGTGPAVAMSVAKIAAVNWVLLTKLVMRALPFHCTVAPETKFVPVTVSVNAAPPGVALEGESKVAVGTALLMVKVRAPDVPPPGEGLSTVIESVPAVAMSLAEIAAVNWVLLTKLVARALPFHCTVAPETKFVPVTVSVNVAPPAVALEGESEVAVGTALLMVKVRAPDAPPPGEGFSTVIESVPAVAMSLAEIVAVNWVLLTKVVARALPFHCTTEPESKFVPVTVSMNAAPPAVVLVSESEVAVGAGLLMAKVRAPDVAPPGEGFATVTETVPAVATSLAEIVAVNWVLLT